MFLKSPGTSMTQYGIAIAVVAVFLVPVYIMLGDEITEGFSKLFNIQLNVNSQMRLNSILSSPNFDLTTLNAGDLGGTYDEPVELCKNSQCTIDYGTIILHGISENYGEIIETAGAPGGTNQVLDLLTQLADQLDTSNPDEANAIRDLIQMGQEIKQIEDRFNNNKNTMLANNADLTSYFNDLQNVTTLAEYNALNANYADLIQSTQGMFEQSDELNIEDISYLTVDFYNLANALHPEGVVFYSKNGGVCMPGHPCNDPTDPDGYYLRTLTPSGSYEDYINGTTPINIISNNAEYPNYIDPIAMSNSTNTPVGSYFINLKNLTNNGALDNNPAAKEILNSLSSEIYGMANDLINVSQSLSNANLLPPNHDPFGIDTYTQHFNGNPQPGFQSPVELLYQDLNNNANFERPELDATLICVGDRAQNPKYQDKCGN